MAAVALWELLNNVDFLSDKGTILHMLWTLHFSKFIQSRGFCGLLLVDQKELLTRRLLDNTSGHLSQHSKWLWVNLDSATKLAWAF
ncbi:hypothetical protein ACHAXS_000682 [Conticribra weissflogii]